MGEGIGLRIKPTDSADGGSSYIEHLHSSVLRHFQLTHELKSGTWIPGRVSRNAAVLGLLFDGAGTGICIPYLPLPMTRSAVPSVQSIHIAALPSHSVDIEEPYAHPSDIFCWEISWFFQIG